MGCSYGDVWNWWTPKNRSPRCGSSWKLDVFHTFLGSLKFEVEAVFCCKTWMWSVFFWRGKEVREENWRVPKCCQTGIVLMTEIFHRLRGSPVMCSVYQEINVYFPSFAVFSYILLRHTKWSDIILQFQQKPPKPRLLQILMVGFSAPPRMPPGVNIVYIGLGIPKMRNIPNYQNSYVTLPTQWTHNSYLLQSSYVIY